MLREKPPGLGTESEPAGPPGRGVAGQGSQLSPERTRLWASAPRGPHRHLELPAPPGPTAAYSQLLQEAQLAEGPGPQLREVVHAQVSVERRRSREPLQPQLHTPTRARLHRPRGCGCALCPELAGRAFSPRPPCASTLLSSGPWAWL